VKKKDKLVNIENKRKSEKIIVKQMIEIYGSIPFFVGLKTGISKKVYCFD